MKTLKWKRDHDGTGYIASAYGNFYRIVDERRYHDGGWTATGRRILYEHFVYNGEEITTIEGIYPTVKAAKARAQMCVESEEKARDEMFMVPDRPKQRISV